MHFLYDRTHERQLFGFSVRDLLPEDSDVWLYRDLFKEICFEEFDWKYSNEGQHPIDPRVMARTIFYGLTHGVTSNRKLETACRNDLRFLTLSGELRPSRRSFDRFVIRHAELMKKLFTDTIKLAQKMNLVRLGNVAIDGTKLKAKTKNSAMTHENMVKAIAHIEKALEGLAQDAESSSEKDSSDDRISKDIADNEKRLKLIKNAKAQIEKENADKSKRRQANIGKSKKSLNDIDALSIDGKNREFCFGYNCQAAVDDQSQIILAADLHDKASDTEALPSILDQVQENTGSAPENVLCDNGFFSASNILETESRGSNPVIATGCEYDQAKEVTASEQLSYTGFGLTYTCMAGKNLKGSRSKMGSTILCIPKNHCVECPYSSQCKLYNKKSIEILSEPLRAARIRMLQRSRTDEFKEVYRYRKAIVEPVFGNIKNKGIKIHVTGRTRVQTWWNLVCAALNVEKIIKAMQRQAIPGPESDRSCADKTENWPFSSIFDLMFEIGSKIGDYRNLVRFSFSFI